MNLSPKNPHTQSILASLSVRKLKLIRSPWSKAEHSPLIIKTKHASLQGFFTKGKTDKLCVLLHGWFGSSSSTYIETLANELYSQGYSIFRLNFRDHGKTEDLNEELFHSCRLEEVTESIQFVLKTYPHSKRYLMGFSLGGNFALRIAGISGLKFDKIFCISPAIDPQTCLVSINKYYLYRKYFLSKWKKSLKRKKSFHPAQLGTEKWRADKSLYSLTGKLLLKYTNYETIEEYLEGHTITSTVIDGIQSQTEILIAKDDPVTPYSDVEALHETPFVKIHTTEHGGHCGFIKGLNLKSYVGEFVLNRLESNS